MGISAAAAAQTHPCLEPLVLGILPWVELYLVCMTGIMVVHWNPGTSINVKYVRSYTLCLSPGKPLYPSKAANQGLPFHK